MIAPAERALIDSWVAAGEVPGDQRSRQAIARMLARWMDDLDAHHQAMDDGDRQIAPMGPPLPGMEP